jgi:competence protein ComEA
MIKQICFAFVLLCCAFSLQAADAIDINTADAVTLEQVLTGIGTVKAQAIVKYREEHGPFKSADDLANVTGIGEKTVEKIRDQVTVSSADKAN